MDNRFVETAFHESKRFLRKKSIASDRSMEMPLEVYDSLRFYNDLCFYAQKYGYGDFLSMSNRLFGNRFHSEANNNLASTNIDFLYDLARKWFREDTGIPAEKIEAHIAYDAYEKGVLSLEEIPEQIRSFVDQIIKRSHLREV